MAHIEVPLPIEIKVAHVSAIQLGDNYTVLLDFPLHIVTTPTFD